MKRTEAFGILFVATLIFFGSFDYATSFQLFSINASLFFLKEQDIVSNLHENHDEVI